MNISQHVKDMSHNAINFRQHFYKANNSNLMGTHLHEHRNEREKKMEKV